jgi:hypothetical protein
MSDEILQQDVIHDFLSPYLLDNYFFALPRCSRLIFSDQTTK